VNLDPVLDDGCDEKDSCAEPDGLECLDESPPDLTGVDGTVFTVTADVDIQAPLLLDVLANKAHPSQKKGTWVLLAFKGQ
jgi:hypothetical protein